MLAEHILHIISSSAFTFSPNLWAAHWVCYWWPLSSSTRALSALFKVTSAVAFEGWRGVPYQIPPYTVHFFLLVWEITWKPSPVTPYSIIVASFVCIVCCYATICSLPFSSAFHKWLNLLFISVHSSHLFRLHRRILKQQCWTAEFCMSYFIPDFMVLFESIVVK